jgi:hypothetical protein
MTNLLHTISHDKAAKGYSHPVSTEMLSEALGGLPQFSEIKLYYRSSEGKVLDESMPGSGDRKLHGAAATALDGYRDFLECIWTPADEWTLTVYTVPSNRKAEIKRECTEHALPALRKWLAVSRDDSWFIGRRALQIGVSEFTDEVALRETHNDRVTHQQEFLKDAG